jgi:glycosyltransferase involved in cell wall biosynthesis
MKTSIVVPTYNRPYALTLCLLSLTRQSTLPDEVLIADDGSGDETRQVIEQFRDSNTCPFVVKHIWQEDNGFRKPRILNETVRNATGDYLLFLDGDCLAHRHYVYNHLRNAELNAILSGKRVELGQRLSTSLLDHSRMITHIGVGLLLDSIIGETRKAEEALVITSPFLRHLLKLDHLSDDAIWGCNFSMPKALFYAINGCDEDFLDGSIEDNDLGVRVINSGGKLKSVRFMANVFHLWHKPSWSFTSEQYLHNRQILEKRILLKEKRCQNGIDGGGENQ